ncbi:major facilitator transporter [Marinobacter santoriniensis NKSG1]|uniref:Major facilitator transporter n=1 Tax=Marinobacter santoriniensis NKSG1 TaxID=1288826 RepID=M7DDK6_9GAMM|nr:MFS transporter [Marinobacter santoriniensis]EMP55757.1 major facilitator transporter [Marinobacter santoriniensis NKSG1]
MTIGKRKTMILAGFIGNVVEWYDFAVYGYMAGILAALFFPGEDSVASLIATYGVFAAGFIMRPLGSGVFGWLGDTIGRSRTMLISVTMMVLPTFLLGCLPTYHQAGLLAPVLLVIIRMVQGLSVGGEFSSSVTYLVETAPDKRRGMAGSWANTGSIFGMLLGAAMAALVTSWMDSGSVHDWGWRLPFLFGGVIGLISIMLRRHLPRSEHFQRHHDERCNTSPLLEAFTTNRRETLLAVIFASAYGVLFYLPIVYLPEWLHSETGMPLHLALQINTLATAILLVLIPVSGWLGDHLIRRTHFIAGAMLCLAITGWPLYLWLVSDSILAAVVVQLLLITFIAVPLGSAPAMFVELFPARDRLSGYSVAYNLGLGVIGGTTPMISTWLIDVTGVSTAPALYLVVMAVIAFVALLFIPDRSREVLR